MLPPLDQNETLLVISVDTEEDNWAPARTGVTVANARRLPHLHAFFEKLGVRSTYFVTHSLAVDRDASRIISDLHDAGSTEIGAHLHPWNTPPIRETLAPKNTMLLNLPVELQRAKIECLSAAVADCRGGTRPTAFRAGRWGIGSATVGALIDCGYQVDSSVTPYTNWGDHDGGPSHDGAPVHAYRLDRDGDVRRPGTGPLVELPPSFGYTRGPLDFWAGGHRILSSRLGRRLRLPSIASRSGALRHVTLSPETDRLDDMVAFTRVLLAEGAGQLHLYFHSPALVPGLTPFTPTSADVDRLLDTIARYVDRASALTRLRFATVSEAASLLAPVPAAIES